jgi:hypothetical protein
LRQEEPIWNDDGTLIACCSEIGASHYGTVVTAFSLSTTVFEDVKCWRNFYAHRNTQTCDEVRARAAIHSIARSEHPTRMVLRPAFGRPQPLIFDWFDDLARIARTLCA